MLASALAGCTGSAIPTPLTKSGALDAFKPIRNSAAAPCDMQREVAAHNAAYDTLQKGTPVVYKAPCDVDKRAPARVARGEPKTS